MTIWLVSRHPGAVQWVTEQGIAFDQHLTHWNQEEIAPGDRVIGTLPIHLAARVIAKGAHYFHLTLRVPAHWRGKELTAEELTLCEAKIEKYDVQLLGNEHDR